MARYIKRVMLSHDYPDLALVGQTIVHINNVPEDFINRRRTTRFFAARTQESGGKGGRNLSCRIGG